MPNQGLQFSDSRTYAIIGAAMDVHRDLGSGFLEAVYQEALEVELRKRGIPFEPQARVPVRYKGEPLETVYKADFVCFGTILVEVKALSRLSGTEEAQIIHYLRATGLQVGLLINFGTPSLQFKRLMNTKVPSSVKSAKSPDGSSPTTHHHASAFAQEAVSPERFSEALRGLGYDFFTGVPCSLVSGLIAELEGRADVPYYPETREDAAVGLACGAMMAGKQPVVVMQNSGLGVCINALASLTLMYKTPCLLLITWRGYGGNDAPEHIIMGDVCGKLLETIGVPWRAPEPETLVDDLEWATECQRASGLPAALLLRAGVTR